ncbi:transglutaminase family protein [Pararhodospirillum photometricum]
MSIHVALTHRTVYTYDRRVSLTPQVIRLRPAPHSRTRVLSYSLEISPKPHFINWQQDPNANWLARVVFPEKVDHFAVTVDLVADMAVYNPFDFFLEPDAERYPFTYPEDLAEELAPYRRPVAAGPGLSAFLATVSREPRRCVDFLVDLNARLQREIKYLVRLEPGVQPPEETLRLGSGSCRDTAWLLVAILRHLGLAARFVSGYLIQLTPDQKPLDGPAGPSADFTDLHAWTEVYLPGAGWVGLDPTSGLLAGEGHIPLAATPDTPSAAPVSGGVEPCETTFDFTMEVRRLHETPRVTKPYTEAQWQAILDLGHAVDRRLTDGDTRLTMGGEPTFVSVDDMDGPEWNTEAVGPTKERLATVLLHRLKDRFAPGGLMLFGQGKWYPGEPLPRWAHHLYWRTDGVPLVQDPEVLGDPAQPGAHAIDAAGAFMTALAETLAVDPVAVQPAFEDPWQMMAEERRLPINLEPGDERLKDPLARARLARALERGLETPVGYVLPVQRWNSPAHAPRWLTEIWQFRQGRCYLIPGDSVMGLRLPLESLPHLSATQYPFLFPVDPFVPRGPLPPLPAPRLQRRLPADHARAQAAKSPAEQAQAEQTSLPDQEPLAAAAGRGVVRTAVCGEIRQGRLHVFLPPAEALEDYIELVEAVEATARRLGVQVILEGYPPPHDPRVNVLKVTPDPGVIEVNVHPAGSWDELVHITETLYDEARHVRLGTEKFMIDGRHVGTGGGNHLVVGGATPADSPFLRRPDLLGSLIRFWQGHPALSYLFSGLFIGPTSQAPRLDEARDETLYDVALALDLLPTRAQAEAGGVAPWVVDRILRDLLIDVTGNTHRTEISIDKLYSPDRAGRPPGAWSSSAASRCRRMRA